MQSEPDAPWEAYDATVLRVRGPRGWSTCQAIGGTRCEGAWPASWGQRLVVITAYNPMSVGHTDQDNERAQQSLVQDLLETGWTFTQARGAAPDGSWTEPSLAVVDPPLDDLSLLLRRYGQAAMFVVAPTACPSSAASATTPRRHDPGGSAMPPQDDPLPADACQPPRDRGSAAPTGEALPEEHQHGRPDEPRGHPATATAWVRMGGGRPGGVRRRAALRSLPPARDPREPTSSR